MVGERSSASLTNQSRTIELFKLFELFKLLNKL